MKLFCYDPETDGNLTFNVTEALTKNWEKIDQLVLLAVAAAAAYDPEGSYAVGDYCTHGGKLHKCGTAIPGGEPWTAEHWTETTVAAELAEVRASLSNKVDGSFEYTSGADFDELIPASGEIALYRAYNPVAHIPPGYEPGACDFMVIAMSESSHSWVRQIAIDFRSSAVWNRFSIGGETIPEWRDWKEISNATPPQVRNLTLQSGFTADGGCTFWKTQESVVTIAGGVSGTLPGNEDTQIGTLQEGFRPIESCRRDATTNVGAAVLEVRTDGTVWIHPHEDAALCWFSAEFVTE